MFKETTVLTSVKWASSPEGLCVYLLGTGLIGQEHTPQSALPLMDRKEGRLHGKTFHTAASTYRHYTDPRSDIRFLGYGRYGQVIVAHMAEKLSIAMNFHVSSR